MINEQLQEIGGYAHILLESNGRHFGPAVAAVAKFAMRSSGPDTIVAVLASNHVVRNRKSFVAPCAKAAEAAAESYIVTLGIRPDHAATGYGYIRPGEALAGEGNVFAVERFVEKHDKVTSARYIEEGCLWNSGSFFFAPTSWSRSFALSSQT